MDPIEFVLRHVFTLYQLVDPRYQTLFKIFEIEGILMLVLLFKIDVGLHHSREDREWSNLVGTLTSRIENLLPQYRESMLQYAGHIGVHLTNNQGLLELVKRLDPKVLQQAERDCCLYDCEKFEVVSTLQEQLKSLITRSKSNE